MNTEKKTSDIPNAINVLTNALEEDSAYYISWQANIAMAFKDLISYEYRLPLFIGEVAVYTKNDIHLIANQAAKNFLTLLCRETPVEAPNSEVVE